MCISCGVASIAPLALSRAAGIALCGWQRRSQRHLSAASPRRTYQQYKFGSYAYGERIVSISVA